MPASPQRVAALLSVVGLLAACSTGPAPRGGVATTTTPAPQLAGALGATSVPPVTVLAGTSLPPAPIVAPAVPVRMSAGEIETMLANNTVTGVTQTGLPYSIYLTSDGRERFRGANVVDSGVWHVLPDGRFCSQLVQISASADECYVLYRYGNVITFQRPDGVTVGNVSVLPGNPQNL